VRWTRARSTLRGPALFAAALVAIGPTLQAAHFAIEHAICAEHGELSHVSSHAARGASFGPARAGGELERPTLTHASAPRAEDDAHCAFERSLTPGLAADPPKLKSLRPVIAALSAPRTLAFAALSILSLAPKSSPPAAA
jgi:hypothetical protein